MKRIVSIGAGVAGVAFLLAGAPSNPTSANLVSRPLGMTLQRQQLLAASRGFSRHRSLPTDAPCTADSTATPEPQYFVGITASNAGNVAGGLDSAVLGGKANLACGSSSAIGGGTQNIIYSNNYSFIGAGFGNSVTSSILGLSFIGAGAYGSVSGPGSFIGAGGIYNALQTPNLPPNQISGYDSFLGAGDGNDVVANQSFLGSGVNNSLSSGANESAIVGGYGNAMTGQKAFLGGGEANEVAGSFATIPGGYHNEALGNESFAAGSQAQARYTGSFVWSDYVSGESPLNDSANDEFVARASGGVYFFSNAGKTVGVHLAAGSGTWSSLSDRNAKTGVVPLDDEVILNKVASLPISTWQYTSERGVRHVGPMAQDFYAAFGVGEDDRHIASIDEDGVALAAIKALEAQLAAQRDATNALRSEVERLKSEVANTHAR